MRSEFEKSLGQTDGFHDGYVKWNELSKQYESSDEDYLDVAEWMNGAFVMYEKYQSKVDELQKRLDALSLTLDKIAHPIPHMQKEADLNGCALNGCWAVKMSEDHIYLKDIARKALDKEQALKGGEE